MSADILMSFILASALIELTPGPNMAYLAILSAGEGRRAGLFAVIGIALGLFFAGVLAALGMAALAAFPWMYQALRWAGVLYLLWLAWEGWNPPKFHPQAQLLALEDQKFFRRGLIINLLNPKAAMFFVAVMPEFIDSRENALSQALALTVLYVMIATIIHVGIVLLAGTARDFFQKPETVVVFRRILSALLALVAVWLAVSTGI